LATATRVVAMVPPIEFSVANAMRTLVEWICSSTARNVVRHPAIELEVQAGNNADH
jgi:hypothetical protein